MEIWMERIKRMKWILSGLSATGFHMKESAN